MKKAVFAVLATAALLIAASPGIRPRADAQSYPAHQEEPDYSIGAVVIPPDQAKKMFKLDLNHAGYVVVEVGVYPAPGKDVDLYPNDFTLSVGNKFTALRPVSADTVADLVSDKSKPSIRSASGPHDVNTAVGASVGRGTYTDPTTGRKTSGTITETDAGVGVGGPAPNSCRAYDCDPSTAPPPAPQPSPVQTNVIAQDLWEKSLPDGKTAHAVAGYLYFPKPSKKQKDAVWELQYENADAKVHLTFPKSNYRPADPSH